MAYWAFCRLPRVVYLDVSGGVFQGVGLDGDFVVDESVGY